MFNKNIKLVLTVLLIGVAVWQFTEGNIGNGIFLILISLMFVLLYFKNEIIIMAFLRLRKQDFEGAKKWLDRIKDPHGALVRKQEGYWHYLNGLILSQNNLNLAEKHLKRAVELGLNMDQDMAMAKLNLAGIAMSKNKRIEAEKLLAEAKKLDKQNMLKDQITMMKANLKKGPVVQQRRY
jgi:tetratricopeptide (TPR) repeat protein